MKKPIYIALAALALAGVVFTSGCSTTTRRTGEQMAQAGQTQLAFQNLSASKASVRDALLTSLTLRKWSVLSDGDPIVAQISHGGQLAKISAAVSDGGIVFETKGSNINGSPYVPIRYVDMLMKTVRKNLK